MSLREGLGGRLIAALTCAAAGVVGLAWAVNALEEGPKPTLRAQPEAVGRPRGAVTPGARSAPFELVLPAHADQLGFELGPLSGALAVASRASAVPPDVAPVVEVLADGSLALRRGVPLADGPGPARPRSREGYGACVVLPAAGLMELTPDARGALCGLLMRWFPERPVPLQRLRPLGFRVSEQGWARLLAWLP